MYGTRRGARVATVAMVALAAVVIAACQPMPHPQFTVREAPSSPIRLVLLAGGGNHVVVEATAATGTVPGPGTWRIDRRDGSAVALPSTAQRISADGQRVLLTTGDLWVAGGIWARPAPSVFSDDLTAVAFRDTDGKIKSRNVATGATRLVETGFPRPGGSTAVPMAVSDDGDTVQYRFGGTVRTVDLVAVTRLDLVDGSSSGSNWFTTDRFLLSASGATVAVAHETVFHELGQFGVSESTVRLHDVASGAVAAEYVNSHNEGLTEVLLNHAGDVAWVYQERWVPKGYENCPVSPLPLSCVAESRAVMVGTKGRTKTFSTGPGAIASFDGSSDGRFLLISKDQLPIPAIGPTGPVHVYDWMASGSGTEVLSAAATYSETDPQICSAATGSSTVPCTITPRSTHGQISDDGRLVAASTQQGGWYEYRTAP